MDKKEHKLVDFSRFKTIPITKCIKADWNYKHDNKDRHEKLLANIKRNGQVENILVRLLDTGFYEVINGNHRYDVLLELGEKEMVVYDFGTMSLAAAQRIAIATNETRFPSDEFQLARIIKELLNEYDRDELLETLPYDEDDIEGFLRLESFDFDQFKNDFDEEDSENKSFTVLCPNSSAEAFEAGLLDLTEKHGAHIK